MNLSASPQSLTWTYLDGDWHEGNVGLLGPRSHAIWQGSSVFDGARWFEGVSPDLNLHAERVNASALALGLSSIMAAEEIVGLVVEGLAKFDGKTAVYIRPMYWAEHGDHMGVPADPASTRFCLCLYEAPMLPPDGFSIGVSPFRRPLPETIPTNAKTGGLYPNNARAILDARKRGFDNAIMLDVIGNVAETATSNIFMVKEKTIYTPVANGCFLSGITRRRIIELLRQSGNEVVEKSLTLAEILSADELFSTGNYSKVVPISRVENLELPIGPIGKRARKLYWEWAHSND